MTDIEECFAGKQTQSAFHPREKTEVSIFIAIY